MEISAMSRLPSSPDLPPSGSGLHHFSCRM